MEVAIEGSRMMMTPSRRLQRRIFAEKLVTTPLLKDPPVLRW